MPKIFSVFSDALARIFGCAWLVGQVHYLNDFLAAGLLRLVCHENGVFVVQAKHETEGSTTCLVFLGILVDTVWWELRLMTNYNCQR